MEYVNKLGGCALNSLYKLPIYLSVFNSTHVPSLKILDASKSSDFPRFCSMNCLDFFGFSPVSGLGFSIICSAKSVTTCPSTFQLTKRVLTYLFYCHLFSCSLCPFRFCDLLFFSFLFFPLDSFLLF